MRDGINLARLGHPVVVLVQSQFEKVAREGARALGVPDLRIHAYPMEGQPGAPGAAVSAQTIAAALPAIFQSKP